MPERVPLMPFRPSVMPCLRSLSSMSRDHIADLSRTLGLVLGRSSLRGGSKKKEKEKCAQEKNLKGFLSENVPLQ